MEKKLRLAFWLGIFISLLSLPTTKKKQTVHLNFKSCFVRLFQEIFFWMVHTYICLSRAAGWQIRIPPMILQGIPSTSLEALVICTKKIKVATYYLS